MVNYRNTMVTVTDVLDSLYSNFVLRDFLSLVTPGAIILGTILYCQFGFAGTVAIIEKIPFLVFFPLFGICYVIGIGTWTFGEIASKKILNTNFTIYDYDKKENEKKYYQNLKKIYENKSGLTNLSVILKTRERFILLMQTCGNFFIALGISLVILLLYYFSGSALHSGLFSLIIISMFLLSVICYYGYVVHREYLKLWDQIISQE